VISQHFTRIDPDNEISASAARIADEHVGIEENTMTAVEELDKLKKLHADGTITDEQFERARGKLLDEEGPREHPHEPDEPDAEARRDHRRPPLPPGSDADQTNLPSQNEQRKRAREWATVLHLSLFAGHIIPFGGIIAPIIIWQMKKDELPELDAHGRNAINWIISFIIYAALSILLCFVLIGFALLLVVVILNVVFPIIAAVKANEGRVWKYPLTIRFLG
jgi:uncharacterized protein